MLILREYDLVWRKPDPRRSDVIASFEIPQDINYSLVQGTEFKVIVPAKAFITLASDNSVESKSADVTDVNVDGTNNKIEFKLPHFELGKYYNVNELVEIINVTGATTYDKLTYTTGTPSAGEWTYDASTGKFTVALDDVTGTTIYIYYAPKGGQIKIVHKVTGAVRTEVTCAVTSTNQHVVYDPGRMPPRIQKTEFLGTRTFLEIHVYPRTINGNYQYEFDPLRPDNTIADIIMVELPLERA